MSALSRICSTRGVVAVVGSSPPIGSRQSDLLQQLRLMCPLPAPSPGQSMRKQKYQAICNVIAVPSSPELTTFGVGCSQGLQFGSRDPKPLTVKTIYQALLANSVQLNRAFGKLPADPSSPLIAARFHHKDYRL